MPGDSVIETVVNSAAAPTWAPETAADLAHGELDWRAVDRALRTIARRRATLDAEEARWLRAAERLEIWRPLGMVSALDYLERVLGYAPRTAQDRLRVARALGTLPELSAALGRGELAFSAVRELTRVATPVTEAEWLGAAAGKTLRQIEELVADHGPGDRPGDPPDPQARTHVVRFELSAETFARLRQARVLLDDEQGRGLADDAFVAALCGAVLDGASAGEPSGRARFQIAMTVCERCRQGWQEGGGVQVAVEASAVERALCDAQHIGSIDGDTPERAYQDIPPAVARLVWRRDGGRCRVPGCRSARGLELHHLVHRAEGGGHDAGNLAIVCSACHQAHHAGRLTITGTADRIEVRRPAQGGENAGSIQGEIRSPAGVTADGRRAHVGARAAEDSGAAIPGGMMRTADEASDSSEAGFEATSAEAMRLPVRADSTELHARPIGVEAHARPVGVESHARPVAAEPHARPVATAQHARPVATVPHARPAPPGGVGLDAAIRRTETKEALRGLGWSAAIAQAATAAAATVLNLDAPLEQWIREALRRCPRRVVAPAPSST